MRTSGMLHVWVAAFTFASIVAIAGCSGGGAGSVSSLTPPIQQDPVQQNSVQQSSAQQQTLGEAKSEVALEPLATATATPVAYVTSYYTTQSNGISTYHTQIDSFNTQTNTFDKSAIGSTTGLPEGATLSADGKILYVTLPLKTTQGGGSGTLDAFNVTPTSATLAASLNYSSADFDLAYAATTGTGDYSDVFLDTASSATFTIDTDDLVSKKTGPSDSSLVEYAYPLSSAGNAFLVDRAGNFRSYNASTNTFGKALAGVTSAVTPGIPVFAVIPAQTKVYGLVVNRSGSGSSTIDVINPSGPTITKRIGISFPCYEVLIDAKGANVYAIGEKVVNDVPVFYIAVIAEATDTLVKTFAVPDSTIRVTPFMAVTPDSLHLLLTSATGSGESSASLDVIDPSTEKLLEKVALPLGPGSAPVQAEQVLTVR